MAGKPLPPQEWLCHRLRYEPATGKLFWLPRTADMFPDGGHSAAHTCNRWNSSFAGKEAFTARHGAGYRHTNIEGRTLLAHRVIWKMVTGADADEVDHINGDRADNRWDNLRSVSTAINRKNTALSKRNTSGVTGVRWSPSSSKWQAFISDDSKMECIGTFERFEDAVAARKAAEPSRNYHPNHGRDPAKT